MSEDRPLRLAIDIDGTICPRGYNPEGFEQKPAFPDMVDLVNHFYEDGYEIFFYTARSSKDYMSTYQFLVESGFKFHALVMDKLIYDVFIDDRAIGWQDAAGPSHLDEEKVRELFDRLNEL